jgi:hypothetical protein
MIDFVKFPTAEVAFIDDINSIPNGYNLCILGDNNLSIALFRSLIEKNNDKNVCCFVSTDYPSMRKYMLERTKYLSIILQNLKTLLKAERKSAVT